MRRQNLHELALDMVRACLPYIDMRRQASYMLQNIEVRVKPTPNQGGSGTVQVRAKVSGREYIKAECRLQHELEGMLVIRTDSNDEELHFSCQVEQGAILVHPLQGPDCDTDRALGSGVTEAFERLIGLALGDWSIWVSSKGGYAGYRRNWLHHEPLYGSSIDGLARALISYELLHKDGRPDRLPAEACEAHAHPAS